MEQGAKKLQKMLNERESRKSDYVLLIICALLVIALILNLNFISRYFTVEVSGGSMENTLQSGDILYADKWYKKVERGDVVILDVTPYGDRATFRGEFIIKRVIATAGDTVKCEEGGVYLKKAGEEEFSLLEEPYAQYPTADFREVTVGEGEIFFMGDHRNNSVDSRSVGCFKLKDVVGVVPKWAIENKAQIAKWERFRSGKTETEE